VTVPAAGRSPSGSRPRRASRGRAAP
jgi:hypothetical protein